MCEVEDCSPEANASGSLARALVGQPRLLLLDDPPSSPDPELRATLRKQLARLQRALR